LPGTGGHEGTMDVPLKTPIAEGVPSL